MWDRHPVDLSLLHMVPAIAEQRGVALAPLLGRAGIAGELHSGHCVARAQVATLLEEFSRRTGSSGIGLELADGADPLRIGPSVQALFSGRSLRECLQAHARHMPSLQGGVRLALDEADGRARWRHSLADSDAEHAGVLNEGIAGFMVAALRGVAGEVGQLRVRLPHRARMPAHHYEDKLEAGLSFGNGAGIALEFDAAWLDRPNALFPIPLPPVDGAAARRPDGNWRDADALMRALDLIIAAAACSGSPSLVDAARSLGLSPRSLQRLLEKAGTSFEGQVDAWRQVQARRHLLDPSLSVRSIARLLGYSDPAHFVRAFRRWENAPPVRWREAMLARKGN